ncbi:hypothetical protein ACWGLC_09105 [Dietzia sp. NPDC055877]
MSKSRTALRSLGVLAAASGLALAGAGVASATTFDHDVDGNMVSATFSLEDGQLGDTCGAVLIPGQAALSIFEGLDIDLSDPTGLAAAIEKLEGAQLLTGPTSPVATLSSLGAKSATVSADEVPTGIYGLVSFCASDAENPGVDLVTIGNPFDIISGLSSDGLLDTASSLLQGGDESGLGAILSSAVGGE